MSKAILDKSSRPTRNEVVIEALRRATRDAPIEYAQLMSDAERALSDNESIFVNAKHAVDMLTVQNRELLDQVIELQKFQPMREYVIVTQEAFDKLEGESK